MKKILFITQNLARTGSEMVLWYLLNHLPPEKYKAYVFCISKGELFNTLPLPIDKSATYKNSGIGYHKIGRTALKLVGKDPFEYQLTQIHHHFKPDLWYVNSIALPQVYPVAEKLNAKVATHFHELLYAFTYLKKQEMEKMLSVSTYCIACSEPVRKNIEAMGHQRVLLQPSFIDDTAIHPDPNKIQEIKKRLNISASDFVWVISGSVIYMKGLNYLIGILEAFKDDPIKIVWIGKSLESGLDYYVEKTAHENYPEKLIFTGSQSEDYYNYLSIADGFLMLSHEESFSLVLIEAAYLGIPIVSVNTGIASEFLRDGMGIIAKSQNIEDIVAAMKELQQQEINKEILKSEATKFTVSQQMDSYLKLLDKLID